MQRKYWLGLFLAAAALLFFSNASLLVTDNVESNYGLSFSSASRLAASSISAYPLRAAKAANCFALF